MLGIDGGQAFPEALRRRRLGEVVRLGERLRLGRLVGQGVRLGLGKGEGSGLRLGLRIEEGDQALQGGVLQGVGLDVGGESSRLDLGSDGHFFIDLQVHIEPIGSRSRSGLLALPRLIITAA